MSFAVEVRTPARLHLGMMSFGVSGLRSFGGVGLMLDRPGVHLRAWQSDRYEARGIHGERAITFAQKCATAWKLGDAAACGIEVVTAPPAHVGLGCGTQLGLAVAAAMRQLFVTGLPEEPQPRSRPAEEDVELGEHELVFDIRDAIALARAVGRGRRSSVGVYGFSRGGMIVEAGRFVETDAVAEDEATRPFSPMVARVRLPSAWRCLVIVAREVTGIHGMAERQAFSRLPPVPVEISAELARLALLDLVPAAQEGRFAEFSAALRAYGMLAGKPFEQESRKLPHHAATLDLLELLGELGAVGAAQSSWGPAVVACCESLEDAGRLLESLEKLDIGRHHDMLIARADSQGAVLRLCE